MTTTRNAEDEILLRVGTMSDGVMADDLVPHTAASCERVVADGLLIRTQTIGQIAIYHTTVAGLRVLAGAAP